MRHARLSGAIDVAANQRWQCCIVVVHGDMLLLLSEYYLNFFLLLRVLRYGVIEVEGTEGVGIKGDHISIVLFPRM